MPNTNNGLIVPPMGLIKRLFIKSGSDSAGNWIRYPDGTQIYYGVKNGSAGGDPGTLTFTKPFVDDNYGISVTPEYIIGIGSKVNDSYCVRTKTETELSFYARKNDEGYISIAYKYSYIAIGRWK